MARKHGISIGQIYTWRNQLLSFRPTAAIEPPQFASVELTSSPTMVDTTAPAGRAQGQIEIVLAGGVLLRVDAHVDGRALRRVLRALAER